MVKLDPRLNHGKVYSNENSGQAVNFQSDPIQVNPKCDNAHEGHKLLLHFGMKLYRMGLEFFKLVCLHQVLVLPFLNTDFVVNMNCRLQFYVEKLTFLSETCRLYDEKKQQQLALDFIYPELTGS